MPHHAHDPRNLQRSAAWHAAEEDAEQAWLTAWIWHHLYRADRPDLDWPAPRPDKPRNDT